MGLRCRRGDLDRTSLLCVLPEGATIMGSEDHPRPNSQAGSEAPVRSGLSPAPIHVLFSSISQEKKNLPEGNQGSVETPQSVIRHLTGSPNAGASPTSQVPMGPSHGAGRRCANRSTAGRSVVTERGDAPKFGDPVEFRVTDWGRLYNPNPTAFRAAATAARPAPP